MDTNSFSQILAYKHTCNVCLFIGINSTNLRYIEFEIKHYYYNK